MTSVGATAEYGGAVSCSSGGMSNVFKSASSQSKAISCYIKPWNGKRKGFYVRGDAQPDFSLLGDDYMMLTGGNPLTRDGTSASAPVFAAMIALVNGMRLRGEKPALGFLRPLLYSAKASPVFCDVKDDSETEGCARMVTLLNLVGMLS